MTVIIVRSMASRKLISLLFCYVVLLTKAEDVVVQIPNGSLRGQVNYTVGQNREYFSFRGIPFAEPPTGNLRFQPAIPNSNWNGILDATQDAAICIQSSAPVIGSDDCLYLNVYTPTQPAADCALNPVLFWIYGGAFVAGSATYQDYGPDYFIENGITAVTINYRVSAFGFLSTQDSVLPGNVGLKDQLLALQWVQNNIKFFCGDPDQVTIAGSSAGAASVAYHLLSPKSSGLFHRAIIQSGAALDLWALNYDPSQLKVALAKNLSIDYSTSSTFLAGLNQLDSATIQNAATAVSNFVESNSALNWAPVSEVASSGAFFSGGARDLYTRGVFNKVPIIIGYDSLEGYVDLNAAIRLFLLVRDDLVVTNLVPYSMNAVSILKPVIGTQIKLKYFGLNLISTSTDATYKFLTDYFFVRGIVETGNELSTQVPLYFYEFSYQGCLAGVYNRTVSGVHHSEDTLYMWRSYFAPCSNQDLVVRDRMVKLWSNFIVGGNPTPIADSQLQNTLWPTYNQGFSYLSVDTNLSVKKYPNKDYTTFWNNLFATYQRQPYTTY